jgi:hypothetical protein
MNGLPDIFTKRRLSGAARQTTRLLFTLKLTHHRSWFFNAVRFRVRRVWFRHIFNHRRFIVGCIGGVCLAVAFGSAALAQDLPPGMDQFPDQITAFYQSAMDWAIGAIRGYLGFAAGVALVVYMFK